MTKLKEISTSQNKKRARKMLAFDFYPPRMVRKTKKIKQKFQNIIISNRKKVNPAPTELTKINKPIHLLIKKGGLPMN